MDQYTVHVYKHIVVSFQHLYLVLDDRLLLVNVYMYCGQQLAVFGKCDLWLEIDLSLLFLAQQYLCVGSFNKKSIINNSYIYTVIYFKQSMITIGNY